MKTLHFDETNIPPKLLRNRDKFEKSSLRNSIKIDFLGNNEGGFEKHPMVMSKKIRCFDFLGGPRGKG